MRRIGTLNDPSLAKRFSDYLTTRSIECTTDIESHPEDNGTVRHECNLWIRDEAQVDSARTELEAFLQSPDDAKYQVGSDADRIRREKHEEEKRLRNLRRKAPMRSGPAGGPLMGVPVRQQSIPVVIGTIILSVIASFATNFGRPNPSPVPGEPSTEETVFFALSFVDAREYIVHEDPFESIKQGQVWRLITPMFLHGDTFHLAFNMIALFILGSAIERLHGSMFMLALLLISQVAGGFFQVFLPPADTLPPFLSGLAGTPFSIGASGAVYGLFGYLWVRPIMTPTYPIRMVPANVTIMLGWLVFCIFFVRGIANGAHIGGLIAGVVIAAIVARTPLGRDW
ncbi:rhomboid family intramembrane serine protease [Roseiconus nitratireducens]|uniref:Rhomboid family intramembrane serine protease n=1 Tax=Roseiconus nitratireducens TaxID=2605748 RepID=A0A5M6DEY0_9BACT|nr:rhomboid family intramembrane serine protease [Roseiconus nitratireducens]KAA5543755.1 rhomboid family intramembrane serine protease [Roseiconus nitratireducens]